MPRTTPGVCRYFSGPGTCPYDFFCRFAHISDDDKSKPSDEPTNNQNNPPAGGAGATTPTLPKDPRYYQPDGSGVFLVDGILFKVQATAIFGTRPKETAESNRKFNPVYIEDMLPRLAGSSDTSPIELSSITKKQFHTYLLLITGLPYDEEYLSLLVGYLAPEKHSQDLFLRYLDIATIAPRFGMSQLGEWAMNALQTVFTESANSFRQIPYDWKYSTLLQLMQLTRETNLDSPVRAFIQYLIYRITQDVRHTQGTSECSSKITDLIEIYQGLKNSNENALLGCVFLNILSLGHRSLVWSHLGKDDKAVLYAAQAQLTDLPHEFVPGSLDWVAKPDPGQTQELCTGCQLSLSGTWDRIFRDCTEGLGSSIPLKDATLLAEMPEYRWSLWSSMGEITLDSCTAVAPPPGSQALPSTSRRVTCSIRPLLKTVDQHIQDVYEQVTSRYRIISKEF